MGLYDGLRADLAAAEDANDNDEVQRLLEEARKNLMAMINSKNEVDKLYSDIKEDVRGDLPPNARDPEKYDKPTLPGSLKWPANPLKDSFPMLVSQEVWNMMLRLLEVDLTDPHILQTRDEPCKVFPIVGQG